MKITPANTETLKPLGDLSILPREIRDEIYQHVFSKTYRAFYSASIIRPASYDMPDRSSLTDREPWSGSNLSILRLSKAIKDEAMPLLYSKATFCFYESLDEHECEKFLRRSNVDINDVANRMTNTKLFLDMTFDPQRDYPWIFYDFAPAGPLQFFQETSITRKSILIGLTLDGPGCLAMKWKGTSLFRAIKQLSGFETVTLRLLTRSYNCCPPRWEAEATLEEWENTGLWEKLYAGPKPLLAEMSDDLEFALGKRSTIGEFIVREFDPSRIGQCEITFHPKDHLQAAMSVEFERLEKWAADGHGYS